MLFLMNNVVFDLDEACPAPSHDIRSFARLDMDAVIGLGCELYAEEPQLHLIDPIRARRLAWLIAHRCEGVNAALFCAPEAGCSPILVEPRFCALPENILDQLKTEITTQDPNQSITQAESLVWNLYAA